MQDTVNKGLAASLTVTLLCVAVALLLRSFYKRYSRMNQRKDENPTDN
jgi:hypothetical protein